MCACRSVCPPDDPVDPPRRPAAAWTHGDWLAARLSAHGRILSDVTRLRILAVLQDGECCVKALAARLGTGPSNVCGHLARLASLGLVDKRHQGNAVFYRLTDAPFCAALWRWLEAGDAPGRARHEGVPQDGPET